MILDYLPTVLNLIADVVLVYAIFIMFRLIGPTEGSRTVVFYIFAMVSLLISNLYWFAYEILRPGTRMPFAANEIGEWATFLLLTAALSTIFHERQTDSLRERAFAVFFILSSVALWIGWSGEWIQDILTGFAFGYLAVNTLNSIRVTDLMPRKTEAVIASVIIVLLILHASIFFIPKGAGAKVDAVCYIIMFALMIYFAYLLVKAFHDGMETEKLICLTFVSFVWFTSVMYMSADPMYFVPQIFCTLDLLLMTLAIRRKVMET